jgi:hypothetical protein
MSDGPSNPHGGMILDDKKKTFPSYKNLHHAHRKLFHACKDSQGMQRQLFRYQKISG